MKNSLFFFLCLISFSIYGQDTIPTFDAHTWQAPYSLSMPKDWAIERFQVPPSFAPSIKYKGIEDIRFAPGWAKTNSEEYWSYCFIWCLDDQPIFTPAVLEKNLKDYYTGLFKINSDSSKHNELISMPIITHLTLIPMAEKESMACTGSIQMPDFMTHKQITLNCKVYVRACNEINKTILFFELSPQPFKHNIWSMFEQLWADFRCKKM